MLDSASRDSFTNTYYLRDRKNVPTPFEITNKDSKNEDYKKAIKHQKNKRTNNENQKKIIRPPRCTERSMGMLGRQSTYPKNTNNNKPGTTSKHSRSVTYSESAKNYGKQPETANQNSTTAIRSSTQKDKIISCKSHCAGIKPITAVIGSIKFLPLRISKRHKGVEDYEVAFAIDPDQSLLSCINESKISSVVAAENNFVKNNINEMAVKKHGLVTNNSNQLDLKALAKYIQLMNEQPGYLPPVPDLVKNCQDIVKCLARSPGNEERRWEMLQSIEEFLLRVVNTVDEEARTAIVNGVIDKFYSYISDPQSDADAATSIVLVVLDTSSVESLMSTTRWVVQQGENGPAGAGLRASLACLYSWLCENQGQETALLGDWLMSFIKALEEKECFDILIEISVDNVDRLFCAMNQPATLRQSSADVIFHVLASLRQSAEAFDKVSKHIGTVLTNLASDSGQFSRQLLQNVVDILTASLDHLMKKYRGADKVAFKCKYGEVNLCLERHMASRGCELLKTAPWPGRDAGAPLEPLTVNPAPATDRKVGLMNLGNTCYMNSVMQALLVTRRFSTHVMLHMTKHPYWEIAAMLFGKLVHSASDKLDSQEFFETMRPTFFTFNHQQDSSEYLGYLFELLQSYEHIIDENYDYSKPPVLDTVSRWRVAYSPHSDSEAAGSGTNRRPISPRPGGSGGSSSSGKRAGSADLEQPASKRARLEPVPFRRNCYVDSVFGGVLLTRVKCHGCKFTSMKRDVFRDLPLAFPEKTSGIEHSVQSLLEYFCQKENMTGDNRYLCPDCGALREAERTVLIENVPNYLILVLKNFKFEPKLQVQSKLIHNMYYNYTINLPVARSRTDHCSYTLYAAVVHCGSTLDSGHYYTLAKDAGSWYKFNDDEVTCAAETQINELERSSTPYLLFYRRDDLEEGAAPALEDLPAKVQEHVLAHNKHYMDSLRP